MSRPVADDVIAVLSEIRHNFQFSASGPSVSELRRHAVRNVARQELNAGRFVDERSAKESIYDACARRLGGIKIGDFDHRVQEWLHGRPENLNAAVTAKTTTEGQRQRLAEVLGTSDSRPATPSAQDLESPPTERVQVTVSSILRDTRLSNRVKTLHNYECQVCGYTLILADGSRYAEGHHIQPLGAPHNGSDTLGNILCLCPNHHAARDLGAIKLVRNELCHAVGHAVDQSCLDYHNSKIYNAGGRV